MAQPNNRRLLNANLILGLATALYTVSPIDLIPDFIPLLGWADDGAGWLATLGFTLYTAWRIHRAGGLQALRRESEGEPITDAYQPMSYEDIRAL